MTFDEKRDRIKKYIDPIFNKIYVGVSFDTNHFIFASNFDGMAEADRFSKFIIAHGIEVKSIPGDCDVNQKSSYYCDIDELYSLVRRIKIKTVLDDGI